MRDAKLTFLEHLDELRNRIIKSVIFFILVSGLFYNLTPLILSRLIAPVGKLVFIYPSEALLVRITIAFWAGLFLSSPFILYQVWQFVSRGLKRKERKYAFTFGVVSFILFAGGASFGYFIILPVALKFLISFATASMTPMLTADKYISFLGMLTAVFGLIFQLPVVIMFLVKVKILTPRMLVQRRREAIVLIFIAAALLTPPDVITQVLLAVPLLVLYEISVFLAKLSFRETRN